MSIQPVVAGLPGACRYSYVGTVAALLALSACGDSTAPAPETGSDAAAAAPARETAEPTNRPRKSYVNSLTFEASGDAEGALDSDGADIMLTGGCDETNHIRMSFTRGRITDKDLFQVRLVTEESVGSGETGTFALSEVGWYNGQVRPAGLPADANILGPDAYKGTGTLTLTTHIATLQERRMAGTLEGVVDQVAGDKTATVNASFDINLACGIAP